MYFALIASMIRSSFSLLVSVYITLFTHATNTSVASITPCQGLCVFGLLTSQAFGPLGGVGRSLNFPICHYLY